MSTSDAEVVLPFCTKPEFLQLMADTGLKPDWFCLILQCLNIAFQADSSFSSYKLKLKDSLLASDATPLQKVGAPCSDLLPTRETNDIGLTLISCYKGL